MHSVGKGDDLEDKFYEYLLHQQQSNELVYGIYNSDQCKIYKKKKYYCKERDANVTFDVVIEVFRKESDKPHIIVVFECKNYLSTISEKLVTDFSDKLQRIFRHGAKGVLVVTTSLQSGAEKIVKNRKIGLVKYNASGFDIVLDRTAEESLIKKGIFEGASTCRTVNHYKNPNIMLKNYH